LSGDFCLLNISSPPIIGGEETKEEKRGATYPRQLLKESHTNSGLLEEQVIKIYRISV